MEKKEKYGFVYIWRDRKHARYYVGCHWGYENDKYICSSTWMRDTYRRRPQDFKRRIIGRVYTNKKDMFDLEAMWLSQMKSEELGKRYYNFHNVNKNHWSTDKQKYKTVTEKNSARLKALHQDPEYQKKYREGRKKHSETMKQRYIDDPTLIERRVKSMKATMAEKFPAESKKYPIAKRDPNTGEYTEMYKFKLKKGVKDYYANMTPEQKVRREEVNRKTSERNRTLKNRLGHTNTTDHNAKIGKANGKIVVIDDIEYYSMSEAGRVHNVSQATVANRIKSDKYPTWKIK